MTDGTTSMPGNDQRADEKPRRAETLDATVPPGDGAAPVTRALPISVDYIRRLKIGRLDSPPDYRRAMNKCIRAMARGILPRELGTGLVWALTQAASEARKELEERAFYAITQAAAAEQPDRYRPKLADDLSDEELADIARGGRPALEMLPADNGSKEDL